MLRKYDINPLKPSGNCMYLDCFHNTVLCTRSVFIGLIVLSEQTVITSLNSINQLTL
jgi:hypothetical protein